MAPLGPPGHHRGVDKTESVLVRVYLTESRAHLDRVLDLLRASDKIRGITVFRGIAGFGSTPRPGELGTASADPPVVLEFFDRRAAVDDTVRYIRTLVSPHHVVMWPVEVMHDGRL